MMILSAKFFIVFYADILKTFKLTNKKCPQRYPQIQKAVIFLKNFCDSFVKNFNYL